MLSVTQVYYYTQLSYDVAERFKLKSILWQKPVGLFLLSRTTNLEKKSFCRFKRLKLEFLLIKLNLFYRNLFYRSKFVCLFHLLTGFGLTSSKFHSTIAGSLNNIFSNVAYSWEILHNSTKKWIFVLKVLNISYAGENFVIIKENLKK